MNTIQSERWFQAIMVALLLAIAALASGGCKSTQQDITEARTILGGFATSADVIDSEADQIVGEENAPHVAAIKGETASIREGVAVADTKLIAVSGDVAKMQDDLSGWLTPKAKAFAVVGGVVALAVVGFFMFSKANVQSIFSGALSLFRRKSGDAK
jgi:hypothetical protein